MIHADAQQSAHALFLLFELDGERYALDAAGIDAVLPLAAAIDAACAILPLDRNAPQLVTRVTHRPRG